MVPNCATYINDICTACVDTSYSLKLGNCNSCATGYRISNLNSSKCIPVVSYCSFYLNDICKSCYNGFILVDKPISCQVQYPVNKCINYELPS